MKLSVMKVAFSLSAVLVLLLAVPFHLNAEDTPAGAWAGTWKFSLEKSKFQVTIDPDGTITVEETSSTGKQSKWSYKPVQGKAVPVEGHGENVTVIATKVNPYKTTQVWNYNGRAAKSYATLSKDGKIQTFHMSGTDKDGKPFTELVVFEKQ
jgi:cytochrome c oxidase assembly protein Cox11